MFSHVVFFFSTTMSLFMLSPDLKPLFLFLSICLLRMDLVARTSSHLGKFKEKLVLLDDAGKRRAKTQERTPHSPGSENTTRGHP